MEFYSISLPNTSAHNLIIGTPYVDLHGKCVITNHVTQETCDLEFKPKGWGNSSA